MRKVFYLLIIFFSVITLHAQTMNKFSVGPVAGYNINFYSGSDLTKKTNQTGFATGFDLEWQTEATYSLIARVYLINDKSSVLNTTNSNGRPVSIDCTLNYILIEPLLKFFAPRSPFYMMIGPGIGFCNKHTADITTTLSDGSHTYSAGNSIDDMELRAELVIGFGYDLSLFNSLTISPSLMFEYGINYAETGVKWKILTIEPACVVKLVF